jgi:hypothetical protein
MRLEIADRFAIDDVAECLLAVLDLTMPNGPAPFLDRLTRLLSGSGGVPSGKVPATSTQPVPNGSSQPGTIPAK